MSDAWWSRWSSAQEVCRQHPRHRGCYRDGSIIIAEVEKKNLMDRLRLLLRRR